MSTPDYPEPTPGEPVRGPASLLQAPLWLLDRLDPLDPAYHVGFVLTFDGPLDASAIESALRDVIQAQPSLRTRFSVREGELQAVVEAMARLDLRQEDLRGQRRPDEAARAILQDLVDAPFELERGPLHRFALLAIGHDRYELGCVFHHIIFDGPSIPPFLDGLTRSLSGQPVPRLDPSPLFELAAAQRAGRPGDDLARTYWEERLAGARASPLPELPPRVPPARRASVCKRALSSDLRRSVEELGRAHRATPFMVVLAGLAGVLGRLTGSDDIAIATPVVLRAEPRLRPYIGLLVNTLVVRVCLEGNPSFAELCGRSREAVVGALRHYSYPFAKVVEAVQPERTQGEMPLASVMFASYAPLTLPVLPGVRLGFRDMFAASTRFPLSLSMIGVGDTWELTVEGDGAKLDPEAPDRLAQRLETFLLDAVVNPERPLSTLSVISREERSRLEQWAIGPERSLGSLRSPVASVLESALDAPSEVRVAEGQDTFTGAELVEAVERRSGALIARGVGPGDRVGLRLPAGIDSLRLMLALHRVGAVYVPLPPSDPPARLRAMVRMARPCLVIGEAEGRIGDTPVVAARSIDRDPGTRRTTDWPLPDLDAPAYVLFTSGSSGRPKGVEVSHRALAACLAAFDRAVPMPRGARWAGLTELGFDISLIEQLFPLAMGGQLVFPRPELRGDGRQLARWLEVSAPDVLQATPTRWRTLLAGGWSGRARVALSGGEPLSAGLARALACRAERVVNVYGPTEATIWCAAESVEADLEVAPDEAHLPIGRPFPGTVFRVLERPGGPPSPIGVPGELVIEGAQLARGYVGADEGGFGTVAGRRTFATGDRARVCPDGRFEVLGRNDGQLKVRGHRVELAEVETALRSIDGVEDAVVTAEPDGESGAVLHGYFVGPTVSSREVAERLAERLPSPMRPSSLTSLDRWPTGPTGKLDRAALPDPVRPATSSTPPTQGLEAQIAAVWKAVLRVPAVGRDEDFFELGGHSLLALRVAMELEAAIGRPVRVGDVLGSRTCAALARRLGSTAPAPPASVVPYRTAGSAPPLYVLGSTELAEALARHLRGDVPVSALDVVELVHRDRRVANAAPDEVAAALADDLKSVGRSPFRILAFCLDIKTALAASRHLIDAGERVDFVGGIDVVGEPIRGLGLAALARLAGEFGFTYPRTLLRRRWAPMVEARRRSPAERAAHADVLRYRSALEEFDATRPPEVPVTLFVCSEVQKRLPPSAVSWLARADARVLFFPGLHDRLADRPWVDALAAAVGRALPGSGSSFDVDR